MILFHFNQANVTLSISRNFIRQNPQLCDQLYIVSQNSGLQECPLFPVPCDLQVFVLL